MLKIYNAYANMDSIGLNDYIEFAHDERYHTNYGNVISGNASVKIANYDHEDLRCFLENARKIKTIDGYIQDFVLFNPYSYDEMNKKLSTFNKDELTYLRYSLNEEAILLFTDYVCLGDYDSNKVIRLFGRTPEDAMYILKPNAIFTMKVGQFTDEKEEYEVLQSNNLGKRLVLSKMERNR